MKRGKNGIPVFFSRDIIKFSDARGNYVPKYTCTMSLTNSHLPEKNPPTYVNRRKARDRCIPRAFSPDACVRISLGLH